MRRLVYPIALVAFVLVAGCGDDGGRADAGVDSFVAHCAPVAAIGQNHGHVLVMTLDEVNGGVDKAYDITGTADHGHRVALQATDFALLQQGTTVSVISSDASSGPMHTHLVRVQCH